MAGPTFLAELRQVLQRDKFRPWLDHTSVALLRESAADLIVSGDPNLISLANDDDTVLAPGELLEQL